MFYAKEIVLRLEARPHLKKLFFLLLRLISRLSKCVQGISNAKMICFGMNLPHTESQLVTVSILIDKDSNLTPFATAPFQI